MNINEKRLATLLLYLDRLINLHSNGFKVAEEIKKTLSEINKELNITVW